MSHIVTLEDFEKIKKDYYIKKVARNGGLLVVHSPSCGFCQELYPVLEQLGKKFGRSYPILKLSADDYKFLARGLGIQGLPTIFYVERGGRVSEKYNSSRDELSITKGICEKSLVCRK
jgi:thioredoxin-like negative regulator of GroEL